VRLAKEQGLSLTGPNGLLKQLTKTVLEAALHEEMTEHLGYEKHDPAGVGTGDIGNGTRSETVLSEASGHVGIDVPRDRAGTFDPQIVKKRRRRLSGVDQIVLSLYAKGLTTGEISAHFAEIHGASVSKETISRITDKVIEEMNDWSVRPLDEIYAAIFIDAIVVKIRDGQVANRPIYVVRHTKRVVMLPDLHDGPDSCLKLPASGGFHAAAHVAREELELVPPTTSP
jgi:transposase-like protein